MPLIQAVLAVCLSWILLMRFEPGRPALILGLVLGVASQSFLVAMFLAPNPFAFSIMNLLVLMGWGNLFLQLGTDSLSCQIGAVILVISLVNLVRMLERRHRQGHTR